MSIIKDSTLAALRTMVRGEFATRMAELGAAEVYKQLATIIPSTTGSNTYGWLSKFPKLIEWVGERTINSMKESSYVLANKKYEATLGIDRADIEDDNLGQYRILARAMADEVVRFFNENMATLLSGGFATLCHDGQYFFDTDHPVYPNVDGTGDAESISNIYGEGTSDPWFLLDLSGSLKPLILQQRTQPEMNELTDSKNSHVFLNDQYLYGIRYRGNFGYGFWQQAVASKLELNAANYQAARTQMMAFTRDGGDKLGIRPTHLVVPSSMEAEAKLIVEAQLVDGSSNINYNSAKLIVADWL